MLKALMKKVDSTQEQIANVRRAIETLIKNQMEMLENRNHNENKECI